MQSWLILTCPAHSQSPIGQLSGSLQAHSKQSYVIIIKKADVFLPVLNFPGHIEPKFGFSSTHCQDPPFLGSTKRKCPSVHSIRHPSTSSPRVLSQKKPWQIAISVLCILQKLAINVYLSAVIIDPKLILISTLTVSQWILCLVAEVHWWKTCGGLSIGLLDQSEDEAAQADK